VQDYVRFGRQGEEGSPQGRGLLRGTHEFCRDGLSTTNKEGQKLNADWQQLISNYRDVFPEEHPGMPPPRQVELKIELEEGGMCFTVAASDNKPRGPVAFGNCRNLSVFHQRLFSDCGDKL
jgi:hypothetical protein